MVDAPFVPDVSIFLIYCLKLTDRPFLDVYSRSPNWWDEREFNKLIKITSRSPTISMLVARMVKKYLL